ncbi:hypothetical protein E2C01_009700 [Portunus trituberculatus]|uniref:Uncharacterized protein n=1 Tax=Portunus trituberculatus TaxID=210409 RepID=A0A5B7D6F3_PORTR|nr:hypothetical protein [Portunus trituberculatus]
MNLDPLVTAESRQLTVLRFSSFPQTLERLEDLYVDCPAKKIVDSFDEGFIQIPNLALKRSVWHVTGRETEQRKSTLQICEISLPFLRLVTA